MAGIYIHIPFCRQACHYCDFHFSTNLGLSKALVEAIGKEIRLQQNYLAGEPLKTIYFGGGTPSLLPVAEIAFLLDSIREVHEVMPDAELTLEANPDDLSFDYLCALRIAGINRLSIGIQSFDDNILRYLNRSHNSMAAIDAVRFAREAHFDNVSIDLIYAIPGLADEAWRRNVDQAIALKPDHISAYSLTIEEKTPFGKWAATGRLQPVNDLTAATQVETLVAQLATSGYVHYEISNFARPGYESKHNLGYWEGDKYLGVGPSAHSYNQVTRQHNVANNHLYIRSLQEGNIPAEEETLAREEKINEYILTALRTSKGCDVEFLKSNFGYDVLGLHHNYINELQRRNYAILEDHHLSLTESGRLLADKISSDLFLVP